MGISYIKVFLDFNARTETLSDDEVGRLVRALVDYAGGKTPILQGAERFLFPMFRVDIDRDNEQYEAIVERNRANGVKGGRPKKTQKNPENPMGYLETQKSQEKERRKKKEEKEEETAADISAVAAIPLERFAIDNIMLRPASYEEFADYMERHDHDLIRHAIKTACARNKASWGYTRGMLDSYEREGIKTVTQALNADANWRASRQEADRNGRYGESRRDTQPRHPAPQFGADGISTG